jgi:predicted MFS family arabinose efflux permease
MLATGVFAVAAIGAVDNFAWETSCLVLAVVLVTATFRLDREAGNKLFPSHAASFKAPIGLCLWTLTLHAMAQTSLTLFLPLLLQVVHGVSPVFVNFVTIVISFSWTIGTVAVSGWSGARERLALGFGPLLAFTALVTITIVATQPQLALITVAAAALGLGIGMYNVHLVARTLDRAPPGEQRTTAAALNSVRSLGTAFGAAIAGVIANAAGLGDATDPVAVGHAVSIVYACCCVPFGIAALCVLRFIRIAVPRERPIAEAVAD